MSVSVPDAKGLLVVFEGLDGVGKSTQLALAREALEAEQHPVHTSRNLGGTPIGEALREVMLSHLERPPETDLYLALAIQEALIKNLEQERQQGKIVLLDRGPLSIAAYQVYGSGLDQTLGWRYVEAGMLELKPDLTLIYTADLQTARQRAKQKTRSQDYFEDKSPAYFERVAAGYDVAAQRYKAQTVVIDAGQPIEVVHQQTMQAIQRLFPKHK